MLLLDTNILIYASKEEYPFLQTYINNKSAISAITMVEVFNYNHLTRKTKAYFESCFSILNIIEVNKAITEKAETLQQIYKMNIPDSIIAATALIYDYTLLTRNIPDFEKINHLKLINPFA